MSFPRVLILTVSGTSLLSAFSRSSRSITMERRSMTVLFLTLSALSLYASFSWPFFALCILTGLLLIVYSFRGWNQKAEPAESFSPKNPEDGRRIFLWITFAFSVFFFLFVCAWTIGRVYSFSAPTYDSGIFSQMFYYMKKSGLPLTTLERDGLLSHFHVHMSPIYYLLLPFYLLAPDPASLQVFQALILVSAVIPLWKLGRCHGLSGPQRMLLCLVLLLYPAFSGGTGYDIHENCFLTPLLLWLFYRIDQKHTVITALSAFLALMVKEDAAVYVAVIALWLIVRSLLQTWGGPAEKEPGRARFSDKNLMTGLLMLTAALLWFFLTTGYLARFGDGVMTNRYDNFLYGGSSSLFTVIKAVILHPMKTIYECVDSEKLPFIAMTLLPLLCLPLCTRRYERYLLLIPYILVNLMSDYPYQHDIFFQYTFGSTACLFYLTIINLADFKNSQKRDRKTEQKRPLTQAAAVSLLLSASITVNAICFGTFVVPKAIIYPMRSIQNRNDYQEIRKMLSLIPDDASVTASTFYTTYLSQRETLYDIKYASPEHILDTKYIVPDTSQKKDFKELATLLEENGYERWVEHEAVVIYHHKNISTQ